MSHRINQLGRAFGTAALVLATGGVARAADQAPPPAQAAPATPPVKIDVQIISATTGPHGVDAKLEKLRGRLSDLKYTSYQLLSEQTVSLSLKSHQTVALPDSYTLEITPQEIEPTGLIRMHLHVHSADQKKIVDTEYAIAPGKDLLVGGMKHDGGALMIALHHHDEK